MCAPIRETECWSSSLTRQSKMTDAAPELTGAAAKGPATDDIVVPFQTVVSNVTGRVVRLGGTVNDILTRHSYPDPVSHVLGEAIALTAMLGSQLKFDGRLILQTKTDGPLGFMVVNHESPGYVRAYASYDALKVAGIAPAGGGSPSEGALLGSGHLAMTIDPGGDMDRYQGIVSIENCTLSVAAHEYFRQSEQLPTFIKLAVAQEFSGGEWRWRAGGLMIQHLTAEGGASIPERDDGEASGWVLGADDDNWQRVQMLASTVEDHELIDPLLTPERLLYRLFHEEGVRVSPATSIMMRCRCARETVGLFLKRFGPGELTDMRDANGAVTVTCEFCATPYTFTDEELE
jgi:molecular chaperone Hsp33